MLPSVIASRGRMTAAESAALAWQGQQLGRTHELAVPARPRTLAMPMEAVNQLPSIPTPIAISDDEPADFVPECPSPLDGNLMEAKVRAQQVRKQTPRLPSSPALQEVVLNSLNEDIDRTATSSPIGTALMERRASRPSHRDQ